jgi:hypothetical protein
LDDPRLKTKIGWVFQQTLDKQLKAEEELEQKRIHDKIAEKQRIEEDAIQQKKENERRAEEEKARQQRINIQVQAVIETIDNIYHYFNRSQNNIVKPNTLTTAGGLPKLGSLPKLGNATPFGKIYQPVNNSKSGKWKPLGSMTWPMVTASDNANEHREAPVYLNVNKPIGEIIPSDFASPQDGDDPGFISDLKSKPDESNGDITG